jgi:NADP-dependent 3-hydroxy acid dehydrogenase YdfG
MKKSDVGATVLVTGGSGGIGRSIVRELSIQGYRVVTCARQIDRLEALRQELLEAGFEIFPLVADLREEASILEMFDVIRSRFGGVDVLINNAGIGHQAPLLSSGSEPWREMLEVNILALCICTREAVQDMRVRGDRGHVVNIASMVGHRVGNYPGIYTATKFAVTALTESVRLELTALNSGIRVSQVSPGRVETDFHEKYFKEKARARSMYSEYKVLEPGDIARAIVYILSQPEHVRVDDIFITPTAVRKK